MYDQLFKIKLVGRQENVLKNKKNVYYIIITTILGTLIFGILSEMYDYNIHLTTEV